MTVTLSISCPTYIRKYVETSFGKDYELSQTDWLGIFIYSLLQKKSHPTYHYKSQRKTVDYDDKLRLKFSMSMAEKNGFFLIGSDEKKIIKCIDDIFRKTIYRQALINNDNYNIDFQTTILNCLEAYDITEDDLPYETLRKDFNRVKKELFKN
jgi:hypothetical protein